MTAAAKAMRRPDIIYGNPPTAVRFLEAGWIAPADDVPNIEQIKADMYDNARNAFTYKDKLLGLSYFLAIRGLVVVNTEKQKELGVDGAQPKNWDEFYAQLLDLAKKGGKDLYMPHWFNEFYGISWAFIWEVINRGGFKVSPAEVDAVLMRHPAVSEAVTFGIAHPTLGEDAIAAVVLRDTAAVTLQELRDFAIDHLADFKVPSRIVPVASIPKTPLGKVRRRALAEALGPALRPAYIAPRDHHEAIIAELFAEILGGGPIGSFDNFFALGGDSLRSAQITSRVNAVFNCQLTAVSLFRRPTVAEFAAAIKGSTRGSDVLVPPPIVALPRGDDQPRDAGDT